MVIGDRECDIFEFYQESKTADFLIRVAQDRLLQDGSRLLKQWIKQNL